MAPTAHGDEAELLAGLTAWLADRYGAGDLSLSEVHRPSAGYSSDTLLVDASWPTGEGRTLRPLVVRMGPVGAGTFPHYDLVPQWQAQQAAAAVGVPVADPVVETDTRWIGAPFMVMQKVDGHIIGAIAPRDRWLSSLTPNERRRVYLNFLATLSTIHRADSGSAGDVPRRDNAAELDFWDDYLLWSSGGSPVPVLAEALAWCRDHQPDDEPPSALLWGDARFENTIIGDDLELLAVLDWDMTSIGAPEHDLAWFTGLALTMEHLFGERVDGFPDRTETIARFEQNSGRRVPDLEWYETLAMIRSTAVMTRIGYLRRDAGEPLLLPIADNPMLDLIVDRIG